MNATTIRLKARVFAGSVLAVSAFTTLSHAQAVSEPARVDVPDGAPTLPAEKIVSNQSQAVATKQTGSVIVEEERIQGRLANARVNMGGAKGYTVVDPGVGRADRQSDNGGKRVSPSLWELFRF